MCRQGQPPERAQASNNSGNWRNTQQSNSNNRSFTKKVYNVREGQEPSGQGIAHPDWPAFQKYLKWLGSDVVESNGDTTVDQD